MPPSEKLRVRQDLATLLHLKPQLKEVEAELARLSVTDPWTQQMTYLVQLPGIGMLTAMTVLTAIGDVTRFPSAKKLVGYAGLGARVYASGLTHRSGGITKQGRRELRSALVEAAWSAVRFDPHWQEQFERAHRIGTQKAIVAIARKLLVVIWHVLTAAETDRRADADKVAGKLMVWAWGLGQRQRPAQLSTGQFIRFHLLKLGLMTSISLSVVGPNASSLLWNNSKAIDLTCLLSNHRC